MFTGYMETQDHSSDFNCLTHFVAAIWFWLPTKECYGVSANQRLQEGSGVSSQVSDP